MATYIPLKIAFATSVHKAQGLSVGPSYPIKRVIGDPGLKFVEAISLGLFYVLLTQAETLRTGNNDSAIYFIGENMTVG
ncbi:MAG: hypothetical protein P8X49_13755 [Syntrophobacterales bacterium]